MPRSLIGWDFRLVLQDHSLKSAGAFRSACCGRPLSLKGGRPQFRV